MRKTISVGLPLSAGAQGVTADDSDRGTSRQDRDRRSGGRQRGPHGDPEYTGDAGQRIIATPDTAMTEEELDAEIQYVESTYGAQAAEYTWGERASEVISQEFETGSGVSLQSSAQNSQENVQLRGTWDNSYDVESNQTGVTLVETDHYVNLYEADDPDGSGRTVLFYRALSYSDGVNGGWYDGHTERITNHIDILVDEEVVSDIDPVTSVDVGGQSSDTFELSVGPASVSTNILSDGGTVTPDTDHLTFGEGGEFGWEFNGDVFGTAILAGVGDVRSPTGYNLFSWDTHTWAASGSF